VLVDTPASSPAAAAAAAASMVVVAAPDAVVAVVAESTAGIPSFGVRAAETAAVAVAVVDCDSDAVASEPKLAGSAMSASVGRRCCNSREDSSSLLSSSC